MGLDMYVYSRPTRPDTPTDFDRHDDETELHSWRGHRALHDWMEARYRAKGGRCRTFNCTGVVLDAVDLAELRTLVAAGLIPHATPLFSHGRRAEEIADDLAFLTRAEAELGRGRTVFYSSWW